MEIIKTIGLIAAVCTTIAFVPQAIRTIRLKETKDLALLTYILLSVGLLLWLTYGVILKDLALILSNAISFPLACTILFMKVKHG